MFGALGCAPDLGDPEWLVTGERILAVRGDPPETRPGEAASYRALVVTPEGEIEDPKIDWGFCGAPKPLTENNAVSRDCLGDAVLPLGAPAATIEAATPLDACARFGPDTPPGNFRPRDADASGGFYQPLRLRFGSTTGFALARVTCDLPNAPIEVAIAFAKGYPTNENPALSAIATTSDGAPVALDRIPPGARVRFETGWSAGDVETYPVLDPDALTLVDRQESLLASWFVTAGELDTGVTAPEGNDAMSNTWTAPKHEGKVNLWVVLRDDRGGVDFAGVELRVVD